MQVLEIKWKNSWLGDLAEPSMVGIASPASAIEATSALSVTKLGGSK